MKLVVSLVSLIILVVDGVRAFSFAVLLLPLLPSKHYLRPLLWFFSIIHDSVFVAFVIALFCAFSHKAFLFLAVFYLVILAIFHTILSSLFFFYLTIGFTLLFLLFLSSTALTSFLPSLFVSATFLFHALSSNFLLFLSKFAFYALLTSLFLW